MREGRSRPSLLWSSGDGYGGYKRRNEGGAKPPLVVAVLPLDAPMAVLPQ